MGIYRFQGFKNADEEIKFPCDIPHGSGIDCDWIIEKKKGYFKCSNSFHAMDANGYYDGWVEFSVIIPFKDPTDFNFHFHGRQSHYLNLKHALREYLEDTMYHWIAEWPEIKKKREDHTVAMMKLNQPPRF